MAASCAFYSSLGLVKSFDSPAFATFSAAAPVTEVNNRLHINLEYDKRWLPPPPTREAAAAAVEAAGARAGAVEAAAAAGTSGGGGGGAGRDDKAGRAAELSPSSPSPQRRWGRAVIFVADVDAVHDKLLAAGYASHAPAPPADAPWGERYFHALDPVGHELSFASPIYSHPRWQAGWGEQ